MSFIQRSGVRIIDNHLDAAMRRGAVARVLTTDYLAITHPDALQRLLDLRSVPGRTGTIEVRAFEDQSTSFHPKAYIFRSSAGTGGRGFVGSNNLSRAGIVDGVEWAVQTADVSMLLPAFERLWSDPRSRVVDERWLVAYRLRYLAVHAGDRHLARPATPAILEPGGGGRVDHDADADGEPVDPVEVVTPHAIQLEALAALEATRDQGHVAGLVVLATGLGKTYLAAFDSDRPEFPRVLFVAHREEILGQARDAFRRVRPGARLGFFQAGDREVDADAVFATVQTLHRHLDSFAPGAFDYVVVDEFHHAAATTYRKVIDHFSPRFLLGLTATPERMDGAELLALCGDNLVHRCDLVDGIARNALVPFRYWGVADTVDFVPIPWRNGRFDPSALDAAVVTAERTDAAFREWQTRAGARTLAFCASIRHAEHMAAAFAARGVRAVALHSRSEPGLRVRAAEQLGAGQLAVLFTVDLFNEGVDLPTLDTVLLLRPTESPVVFLQQLGRGLRTSSGKSHLDAIDFVGNHRSFLAPIRTLLSLRLGRPATADDIESAIRDRDFGLPAGCSIEYSLQAIELLEFLVRQRRTGATDVLRDLCVELAEEDGLRPSALQVALAGGNVAAARNRSPGGWFGLLGDLELLDPAEQRVVDRHVTFLREVETTAMSRSFKMVLLRALLHDGHLRSGASLADLAARSLQVVQGDPRLAADVQTDEIPSIRIVETDRWRRYWRRNPVDAWTNGPWFTLDGDSFRPTFTVAEEDGGAFEAMVAELVEWRMHTYLRGTSGGTVDETSPDTDASAVLRVSHAGGTPILRLDRGRYPFIPEGETEVLADGELYSARFVKVAVNLASQPGTPGNALAVLLRRWFGPAAGHPGSDHLAVLERGTTGSWTLRPLASVTALGGDVGTPTLPHFPTYAVACGAFAAPVPADLAPQRLMVTGAGSDADEFLVTVRGDSMAGGSQPLVHGDLVRMRWTRSPRVDDLVGRAVLVERFDHGARQPALKVLQHKPGGGYLLKSTGLGYDDIDPTDQMTIVGELVERVDPSMWNPLGRFVGQEMRRDAVPQLFGVVYNPGNWQSGHVSLPHDTVLFVTLTKEKRREGSDYVDRFEDLASFHWTSQSSTSPDGKRGREIIDALDTGQRIHLFARSRKNDVAFAYCGLAAPLRHEGGRPMTVWFRLLTPLDPSLRRRFL